MKQIVEIKDKQKTLIDCKTAKKMDEENPNTDYLEGWIDSLIWVLQKSELPSKPKK